MNAWQMHRHILQNFTRFYGSGSSSAAPSAPVRTDADAIADAHRFLWDGGASDGKLSWEQRLARRYHDKLFKEYALADMSRYREGAVGLRWRTDREVFDGKGHFVCGNKACSVEAGLASFELNFAYVERGERRQALVKLRVCPACAHKLNYRKEKEARHEARRAAKRERKSAKHHKSSKRRRADAARTSEDGESSDDSAAPAAAEAAPLSDAAEPAPAGEEIWLARPATDKTQAEEFEDYFASLSKELFF
jgi:protein FRA10AC1